MATTNNRNTKNMSVHMTLTRGETVLAEDDFSLAKGTSGKVNMKLIPQSPVSLDGTEKVTLRMEGEGSAKIYGLSGGVGATVNGTPSETGLYVQMTLQTGSTPMSAAYLGIMLMLLGLAPLPGRKKHG